MVLVPINAEELHIIRGEICKDEANQAPGIKYRD